MENHSVRGYRTLQAHFLVIILIDTEGGGTN